jgi:hypothetical protein
MTVEVGICWRSFIGWSLGGDVGVIWCGGRGRIFGTVDSGEQEAGHLKAGGKVDENTYGAIADD